MERHNANKRRQELARQYTLNTKTVPEKGYLIKGTAQKTESKYKDNSEAIIKHYRQYKIVKKQLSNLESKKNIILENHLLPLIYRRAAHIRHQSTTHQSYKADQLQDLIKLFESKDEAYTFRKKYLSYKL